jgi:predicted acetyltransferase
MRAARLGSTQGVGGRGRRPLIISQNDRYKNALNAPQFFAVLAAQAQFLDALLKRSEEFLQLFVANFALQCLEARLSFKSRQRIFRSACKCMQEHRKNGIF